MTSDNQSKADPAQGQEEEGWKKFFHLARAKAREREQKQSPSEPAKPPRAMPLQQTKIIPFTPKGTAPMGNKLARTPLFAPIKRGRRQIFDMAPLPAPEGISLWYFGKQLDVADQDTYLTALMLAKGYHPDTPIKINRAEFLRLMGRKKSGAAFAWLEDSFDRISTGRLFYDTPKKKGSTPLLGPLEIDKDTGEYFFTVPEKALRAFGIHDFGYVDMEKRLQIAHKADLAKWLQCYAISHDKGEHRVTVDKLKEWSGYEGRLRDFRNYLAIALDELVRVEILNAWNFYDGNKKIQLFR